jgi:hypothetical protein
MPEFNLGYTLNGSTSFNSTELNWFTEWDVGNRFMMIASYFNNNAEDIHNVTFSLTSNNWYISTLRFAGASVKNVTFNDVGTGANKRINYLDFKDARLQTH